MKVRNDRVDRVDSLEVASVLKKAKKETKIGRRKLYIASTGFLLSQGNQGKSGNLKIGQRIQGKSQNSVDVREKSGNFISSCGKKENDSF